MVAIVCNSMLEYAVVCNSMQQYERVYKNITQLLSLNRTVPIHGEGLSLFLSLLHLPQ